jgi:hypothetical protein
MTLGKFVFEGTVEEIVQLKRQIAAVGGDPPERLAYRSQSREGFVDTALALEILQRRPLSREQIMILRVLSQASEGWVKAPDLQRAVGYDTRRFAGLMGAFGRRVAYSSGIGNLRFFDQKWDAQRGYNLYRLPDSVRAAVRQLGLDSGSRVTAHNSK